MPDSRYRPPTLVTATEIPWLSVVQRADPDFEQDRHREYVYGPFENGRWFWVDPTNTGAYRR